MPALMLPPNVQSAIYRPIDANDDATSRIYEGLCASVASSLRQSTFLSMKARFAEVRERLESTVALAPNWDTYGADAPNERARELARNILSILEANSLAPIRLMPSVEGGIGISFVVQDNRADIEIYNTGEIAAATYSSVEAPETWTVPDTERFLEMTINRIRVHLAA